MNDLVAEMNRGDNKKPFAHLSPQCRKIIRHMRRNPQGTITPDEAITYYRIMSLTRRMNDLKDAGYWIEAEWRAHPVTGQRYRRYRLVE